MPICLTNGEVNIHVLLIALNIDFFDALFLKSSQTFYFFVCFNLWYPNCKLCEGIPVHAYDIFMEFWRIHVQVSPLPGTSTCISYIFNNFIHMALSKSIRKCYFPGKNSDASAVLHAELHSFEENPYSIILLVFQTIFMQSKSNWADGSLLVQRSTPEKCEYARHVNILMYIDIICVIPSLY